MTVPFFVILKAVRDMRDFEQLFSHGYEFTPINRGNEL
jgi:hypothetical protein